VSIIRIGLLWATFISTQNVFLLKYESLFPFWEYLVVLRILEINVYYSKNDDDAFLLGRTSNAILLLCDEVDDMIWLVWIIYFRVWIAVLIYFKYFPSFVLRMKWSAFIGSHNYKHQKSNQTESLISANKFSYIRDWGLVNNYTF